MRIKLMLGLIGLALVCSFSNEPAARADDVAAKAAALPQVGFIAVKSIDSFTAFVKKVGVDLPPVFTTQGLEQQFPFLGPGSLDTTKPIGIVVCGGDDLSSGQSMAFVFPVKPTGATLDSLQKLGNLIPDHPDTVLVGTVGMRRTADYLIFSPAPAVATSVNVAAMVDAFKGPDSLARTQIDFKTLRTALPDRYKAMIESLKSNATSADGTKADRENSLMFVNPIISMLDTIDRLDVGVDIGEQGLRLALTGTPLKIATAGAADRPGMPPGVFARVDTNFASTDSTAAVRDLIQKAMDGGAVKDGKFTDDQKTQMKAVTNRMGALIFDAATTSVGVEMVEAVPVLCIVQHWSKPIDAPQEWKRVVQEGNKIAGEKDTDTVESYAEDALAVTRVNTNIGSAVHIDVAQKENDVFITVATSDAHYLHALLAAQTDGPMKGILSGSVDLARSFEAAGKMPNSPLAAVPADIQKQIGDLLTGQKIAIGTSADGESGTLEVTITKGMLENLAKLVEIVHAPPNPADSK